MGKKKVFFVIMVVVCVVLFALSVAWIFSSFVKLKRPTGSMPSVSDVLTSVLVTPSSNPSDKNDASVLVARVIDGDTVELEDGRHVRYIGMNTPELLDKRKVVQCFAREASKKNAELVLNKRVRLEKDVSDTDKYGRLLRYVYADDVFVNDILVREGYAHASSYPPDVKYRDQFRLSEQDAREANVGLWSSCSSNASQP